MLDTTSANEFPLFGAMSSTYGMEAIVIQRPLPTASYSWSDFPITLQDDSTTTTTAQGTSCNHHYGCHDSTGYGNSNSNIYGSGSNGNCSSNSFPKPTDDDFSVFSSSSSSSSTLSSFSSQTSMFSSASSSSSSTELSESLNRSKTTITTTREQQQQQQLPPKRNVRFSPPRVRTYSLVLGDHPFCNDGLAIELGWDYCEEDVVVPQQSSGNEPPPPNREASLPPHMQTIKRSSCQRRSYLSRKQLLLNVAGCTSEELEQRTRDLEAEKAKIGQTRSCTEDYYYCLAFPKRR